MASSVVAVGMVRLLLLLLLSVSVCGLDSNNRSCPCGICGGGGVSSGGSDGGCGLDDDGDCSLWSDKEAADSRLGVQSVRVPIMEDSNAAVLFDNRCLPVLVLDPVTEEKFLSMLEGS